MNAVNQEALKRIIKIGKAFPAPTPSVTSDFRRTDVYPDIWHRTAAARETYRQESNEKVQDLLYQLFRLL